MSNFVLGPKRNADVNVDLNLLFGTSGYNTFFLWKLHFGFIIGLIRDLFVFCVDSLMG